MANLKPSRSVITLADIQKYNAGNRAGHNALAHLTRDCHDNIQSSIEQISDKIDRLDPRPKLSTSDWIIIIVGACGFWTLIGWFIRRFSGIFSAHPDRPILIGLLSLIPAIVVGVILYLVATDDAEKREKEE